MASADDVDALTSVFRRIESTSSPPSTASLSNLEEDTLGREVLDGDTAERSPERSERGVDARCIRERRIDPDVQVFREARDAVDTNRVSPTRRYLAPTALNSPNMSEKSRLMAIRIRERHVVDRHLPDRLHLLTGRDALPELAVKRAVIISEMTEASDGAAASLFRAIASRVCHRFREPPMRHLQLARKASMLYVGHNKHSSAGCSDGK